MLLIGHRGCYYPGFNQNTLRAFAKVAAEGVAAIEFDVQLSADGKLVVIHDLQLEEVSTGTGRVAATHSDAIKKLYSGDPARGKDQIPFLEEVFDFFAAFDDQRRPIIQLELKGEGTGVVTAQLLSEYVEAGRLCYENFLLSSFNWDELNCLRQICPTVKIGLLDGCIRREVMLQKLGAGYENYFEDVFYHGGENYMFPRWPLLSDNLALLENLITEPGVREVFKAEIGSCLTGDYYNDQLLDAACEMGAYSLNLWFGSLNASFVEKAHSRDLAVFVYTVNRADHLLAMAEMGVDGIFTDYYSEAKETLARYL